MGCLTRTAHYGSFFPEPETTFLMALSGKHQAQGEGCDLGCALLWVGAVQELRLIQAPLKQGVTVASLQAGREGAWLPASLW